jgi:hypothetical protein
MEMVARPFAAELDQDLRGNGAYAQKNAGRGEGRENFGDEN